MMGDMPRWKSFVQEVLSGKYREGENRQEGQTANSGVKLKKEMEENHGKMTQN